MAHASIRRRLVLAKPGAGTSQLHRRPARTRRTDGLRACHRNGAFSKRTFETSRGRSGRWTQRRSRNSAASIASLAPGEVRSPRRAALKMGIAAEVSRAPCRLERAREHRAARAGRVPARRRRSPARRRSRTDRRRHGFVDARGAARFEVGATGHSCAMRTPRRGGGVGGGRRLAAAGSRSRRGCSACSSRQRCTSYSSVTPANSACASAASPVPASHSARQSRRARAASPRDSGACAGAGAVLARSSRASVDPRVASVSWSDSSDPRDAAASRRADRARRSSDTGRRHSADSRASSAGNDADRHRRASIGSAGTDKTRPRMRVAVASSRRRRQVRRPRLAVRAGPERRPFAHAAGRHCSISLTSDVVAAGRGRRAAKQASAAARVCKTARTR